MGFPRFWGMVTSADTVMGPDVGDGKRDENWDTSHKGRLAIVWTIVYYVLLVVGAVAWQKFLWPVTESESTLTKF
jgi:prenyl protein peptidase